MILALCGCGSVHSNDDVTCTVPSPPHVAARYDHASQALVVGAAPSYEVRVAAVAGCQQIDPARFFLPVAGDATVIETSQAPIDMSRFDRCDTCYYYTVYAVHGKPVVLDSGCVMPGRSVGVSGGFIPSPCRR